MEGYSGDGGIMVGGGYVLMVGEGTVVMDGWRDDGERGRVQWWCRNRW